MNKSNIKIPIFRYFTISQYDSFKSFYDKMIFYYPRMKIPQRHNTLDKEIEKNPNGSILVVRFPGMDIKNLENDYVYYQLKYGFGRNNWYPSEIWLYLIK